jgi:hypothetical protein
MIAAFLLPKVDQAHARCARVVGITMVLVEENLGF